MKESFISIFNKYKSNNKFKCGDLIKCKILSINKNYIMVDSNLKSESFIDIKEFYDEDDNIEVNLNDEVNFLLESIDNGKGETVLSRSKAKLHETWLLLDNIYKNNLSIKGYVNEKVRGGFTVKIFNKDINAFLPGSLVGINFFKEFEFNKNNKVEFKLIKIDKSNSNIVLSRKAILDLENNNERLNVIKSLKINDILKGVVKNITDYGAFIDLGKIDGLLHITDISWKRIKHPSDVLKIGEEISIKILKFDFEKLRISLGLKQLTEDPWDNLLNKYPVGYKFKGNVTNLVDYGCFVEIEDGIEGLVHTSEMSWKNKNLNPYKFVKIGDKVDVTILNIDTKLRRISMGMKQCSINPWETFINKYKISDKVYCIIKSITDFGIFVEVCDDKIDGLIHITDISWNDVSIDYINNKYKKGDKIISYIINLDKEKERVSLGLKQLEDPFDKFILNNKKGNILNGKVISIKDNIVLVKLNNNINGSLKLENNKLKENDIINVKIINFDKKNRNVDLCIYNKNSNFSNVMTEAFKLAKKK
ncbi:30S ribosomal protein S1 [endosymbiont of Sipalinus gigas]|uniref:30S ribosomal protein S1 n=1 Tax=endosymbiont of Sipalinus gigas TaxID=1972134 RepID=UPI000DC7154A|nr:30S ribosomal protein S1 [endosymbiont of Sipalinus gigas]BBA85164.1 30S ribosomal protein S1 [endosymbiont of Sipalinus gigas]